MCQANRYRILLVFRALGAYTHFWHEMTPFARCPQFWDTPSGHCLSVHTYIGLGPNQISAKSNRCTTHPMILLVIDQRWTLNITMPFCNQPIHRLPANYWTFERWFTILKLCRFGLRQNLMWTHTFLPDQRDGHTLVNHQRPSNSVGLGLAALPKWSCT